jgi:dTDP-4-amino-4,6-dideoxygalactose transaminase
VKVPVQKNYATPVYLHYVLRVPNGREQLKASLHKQSIEAKVHYPIPNHLQKPIIAAVGQQGPFPTAERSCDEVLSLPCDPAMDDTRIRYVVDAMKQHFAKAN